MMIPLLQVDAFTKCQYAGNPAGVCFPVDSVSAEWMQNVAAEMNLAETAFLMRRGEGSYDLRWFTPTVEVPLCGHATLASAHAIWERGLEPQDRALEFSTASGVLRARRLADGWIEMDFPVTRLEAVAGGASEAAGGGATATAAAGPGWDVALALGAALGVEVREAAVSGRNWVLRVDEAAAVRTARPDLATVAALGEMIILTAAADGVLPGNAALPPRVAAADFVSRVFVPAWGISEDPVTGSAHCALAPFWAERLGRSELTGFQASARGGVVGVALAGDRVLLRGQAVTVIDGQLRG